jgi:hypothetical protein|tara:strand:- start:530 stop:814 length:285 start_codon:yes stop_codon:yes gene_type:complete
VAAAAAVPAVVEAEVPPSAAVDAPEAATKTVEEVAAPKEDTPSDASAVPPIVATTTETSDKAETKEAEVIVAAVAEIKSKVATSPADAKAPAAI